jgi:hypothetical protein
MLAGAGLAVVLLAAVLSLRGQVEPSVAGSTEPAAPTTTTAQPLVLPVRPAMRNAHWWVDPVPAGTATARAYPEHVVQLRLDEPPGSRPSGTIVVLSRDGSGLETSYRPQPAGWEPADWLIMDGALFLVETLVVEGAGLGSRLMRVDLVSGLAEEIQVHAVQRLAPSLLSVGDELIGTGVSATNPIENCAIAIRPKTHQERVVACGLVLPTIASADGGVLIKLPDSSPGGCSVRLLLPGRGAFGLLVFVGYCRQRQIIPLGIWQAYQIDGPFPAQPLLATEGNRQFVLGPAKVSAVSCHGRLYWVSGGRQDSPYGVEVLRWTPGVEEVEVVHRNQDQTELGWPTCAGGTLTVPVYSAAADGSRLLGLRVLDRP